MPDCLIRHIAILVTILLCRLPAQTQSFTPVDYTALDVDISFNPADYDILLDRFTKADPTLGTPEVSRLYYGSVCSHAFDSRSDIMSLDFNIRKTAEAGPASDPSLPVLSARVSMLVAAILASGLGTIPQAPFFVTSYDDAIALVREIFGAREIIGRSSVGDIDAIKFTLDEDPGRQHILYFNTYRKSHNRL